MDDDPYIPVADNSGNSSSANNYFINNVGRPSVTIMVVAIGLALGLSVGAIVISVIQGNATERRAADATSSAEVLRIYVDELTLEMAKAGIEVPKQKE